MTRIRECRENANLSQKYVAITLGVSAPSVANWERGKTNPTHENLVRLAELFGVSVDYLLGLSDEPNAPAPEVARPLTDDEQILLDRYRALSDEDKEAVRYTALQLKREAAKISAHMSAG